MVYEALSTHSAESSSDDGEVVIEGMNVSRRLSRVVHCEGVKTSSAGGGGRGHFNDASMDMVG